ncbi:caspase family protein [Corallococcus sp. M34]|uniref:caspase family protein n=1 Tax=Citreicoccus inhibens TaxID=2849499 RepID=UPI001C220E17|nr:caspase family protein [Citreicoccus inhibens]MBU8900611.1 caspase family protein [Citreicoccus inhibens]
MRWLPWTFLLLPWLASAAPNEPSGVTVRRFALLVGVNDGGTNRLPLRYAASDARAFGDVLVELGGVQPADRILLVDSDRAGLVEALKRFSDRVKGARGAGRTEALIYYSGHSDEEGLLLKNDRFGYSELRKALESLPADVRIAILDSCASGTLARQKGGVLRPAFLVDASSAVRGHAILTSSSEDEVSQESDRIGGSFFTHNLVSGLRGAADSTGDGRVTLHEAYQFAFHETLARTEKTRAGAQHPAYDIELAGTGDLVMTDLRATSAALVLADGLEGRMFVRDEPGRLVVELNKLAGRSTELGLQPGRYVITRERRGEGSEAAIVVREGARAALAEADFHAVTGELTALRGGPAVGGPVATGSVGGAVAQGAGEAAPPDAPHRQTFLNLGVAPGVQTNDLLGGGERDNALSLSLGVARMARVDGVAMALGGNWTTESMRGVMMGVGGNYSEGDASGVLLGVGANWVRGRVDGVQAASGVNLAGKGGSVYQLSSGVNLSGAELRGAQLGAAANWAEGDLSGVQLSAGINMVRGRMKGIQGAAGLSWADTAEGMQLSIVNVGTDVSGAQLGLINIAGKMRGLQLGVVNVANDMEGVPLGLLSIARNGQFHVEVFGSDINPGNVALKAGSRTFYSTLVAGMGDMPGQKRHWTIGLGLGAHLSLSERLFADVDVISHNVFGLEEGWDSNRLLHQARLMGGWQITPHLALIGGPTFNVLHSTSGQTVGHISRLASDAGTRKVVLWPGAQLGLRI